MEYKLTNTITGANYTVNIHRPILSDSERKKAEQDVVKALERFGKEMVKNNGK